MMPDGQAKSAYKWLSRGLEEALIRFIGSARNNHYALRAAVYEFNHDPILKAFKQAADHGGQIDEGAQRVHSKSPWEGSSPGRRSGNSSVIEAGSSKGSSPDSGDRNTPMR